MSQGKLDKTDSGTTFNTESTFVGINPCLIPLVAEKIIKYILPHSEGLRKARLVCKEWSKSASKALRKESKVRVGEYCTNIENLSEFLALAEKNQLSIVSVTNFTFCQDVFQPQNEAVLKKFFKIYNPCLSSLTFWFDLKSTFTFDDHSLIFDPAFNAISFPKLEYIEWDDRRRASKELFENSGPTILEWLIQRSPNLQELSIHMDIEKNQRDSEQPDQANPFLQRLFSQETLKFLKNLKALKLNVNINDTLLQSLQSFFQNMRLNSLTLNMKGSSFTTEYLTSFLTTLQNSLKELRILSLSERSTFIIRFPESMKKLQLLELSGWDNAHLGNASINYSRNFPNLKTLYLDSWIDKSDWKQFFDKGINACRTVEELRLPEEVVLRDTIIEIVKLYPNLKKLDLPVSIEEIEVLQIVFEHWTSLIELTIRKCSYCLGKSRKIVDHIFTGLPKEFCDTILGSTFYKRNSFPVLYESLVGLRSRPGLTNLKSLKRLEIKELQYIVEITDTVGLLGFLLMDQLEYLNSGRSLMSNSCLKKLVERFPDNMAFQSQLPRISPKSTLFDEEDDSIEFPKCVLL